ncbi:hypothetical protein BHM03_00023755 [Ensete ventricosum]|nr:hypothetical protein BHM03_00023755 [Ensete ventricosum]
MDFGELSIHVFILQWSEANQKSTSELLPRGFSMSMLVPIVPLDCVSFKLNECDLHFGFLRSASGWRATRVATDAAGGEEWLATTIEKESKAEAYFESGYDSEGSSSKRGGSGVMRSEGEEQRWPRWQRRARPRRRLRRLQRQRKQGAGIAEEGSYGCEGRW